MAGLGRRTYLKDVNPYLVCPLCRGYLVDATTVVECLHSFCRSCILKYLNAEAHCPSCKYVLNKAKPNIKADKALQDIVYKLVPGLYHREMRRRRDFYKKHPESGRAIGGKDVADAATPEQRGEDVSGRLIFAPEDAVSLSLEYLPPGADPLSILLGVNDADVAQVNNNSGSGDNSGANNRRYLQCPALVTIAHLKKFLALKYSVDLTRYGIEICHRRAPLPEHWTLMDVAYIYAWKRNAPMRFFYRVAPEERLEAPTNDRPSTPGLGASLPPSGIEAIVELEANGGSEKIEEITGIVERGKAESEKKEKCNGPIANSRGVVVPAEVDKLESVTRNVVDDLSRAKIVVEKLKPVENEPSSVDSSYKVDEVNSSIEQKKMDNGTAVERQGEKEMEEDEEKKKKKKKEPSSVESREEKKEPIIVGGCEEMRQRAVVKIREEKDRSIVEVREDEKKRDNGKDEKVARQIKSPIKILKNPDGRYEVMRSPPPTVRNVERHDQDVVSPDVKSASPEFSVVSIGDGQNSNGVKITLKQRSPTNASSKKPKVVSNVLLRCGRVGNESGMAKTAVVVRQLQQLERNKAAENKQEKQRRRVTFFEGTTNTDKSGTKKSPTEHPDKKQFLHSFQLTARETMSGESYLPDSSSNAATVPLKTVVNSTTNARGGCSGNSVCDIKVVRVSSNVKEGSSNVETSAIRDGFNATVSAALEGDPDDRGKDSSRGDTNKPSALSAVKHAQDKNRFRVNGSNNIGNAIDVYAFPGDPPTLPAGAVKRKCPPGLPISEVKRRRQQARQNQSAKRATTGTPFANAVKTSTHLRKASSMNSECKPVAVKSSIAVESSFPPSPSPSSLHLQPPCHPSRSPGYAFPTKAPPMLSNDTRNLLDGCGLNIPASLSITLTAAKSPGHHASTEPDVVKNEQTFLGKVNPSITLNDRSVDPCVLKALKSGQMRMPAPAKVAKSRLTDREAKSSGKRKRDQGDQFGKAALDLSGGKKTDVHPLRIPQPVSKLKGKSSAREKIATAAAAAQQAQVVTLMGGQKYYRAPPGSLTPAAHRVTVESPLPTPARAPVYAPSCMPLGANHSGNLSSIFPSFQSLYALNQAPNLQQFQMDASRIRLPLPPRTDVAGNGNAIGIGKSHLAAQCAPVKPARSSVVSLAVPIVKQQSGVTRGTTPPPPPPPPPPLPSPTSAHNRLFGSESKVSDTAAETDATRTPECLEARDQPFPEANVDVERPSSDSAEGNSRGAASPRVSSTVSPSPSSPHSLPRMSSPLQSSQSPLPISASPSRPSPPSSQSPSPSSPSSDRTSLPPPLTPVKDAPSESGSNLKNDCATEVTSSKSPASPDSSSVLNESPLIAKPTTTSEGRAVPTARLSANESTTKDTDSKRSESTGKPDDDDDDDCDDNNGGGTSDGDDDKETNSPGIDPSKKQMTSEMFQKRLLAAFPTNEWANNPVAAKHLGNFLKSLTSMHPEDRIGSDRAAIDSAGGNKVTLNAIEDKRVLSDSKVEAKEQ